MVKEKHSVDLNAKISELQYEILNNNEVKYIKIDFRNFVNDVLTAIRFELTGTDSFGDTIEFEAGKQFEIKRADLRIKPHKKASFITELGCYDVKEVSLKLVQIVYEKSGIVVPGETEIIEYEIEKLEFEDKKEEAVLKIMRESHPQSVCYPEKCESGWICSCGYLNALSVDECCSCGAKRDDVFERLSAASIENIMEQREEQRKRQEEEIIARENKEAAERAERRRAEEERIKAETELAEKKKKRNRVIIAAAIVIAIMAVIAGNSSYTNKYSMSDEEKIKYDIAQSNYDHINHFVIVLYNAFYDEAYSYQRGYGSESRMSEAEQDSDYQYAKGIYKVSTLLYQLIEEQYPEKYQPIYQHLVRLRTGDVFNEVQIAENLYVRGVGASSLIDRGKEIDEAIDRMDSYLKKEVLNAEKVEYPTPDMPIVYYLKTSGISLGILFYEDGSIKYIGECKNGRAEGFGCAYYSKEDGGGSFAEGTFARGYFVSGKHYGTEGNTNDIIETQKISFDGNFVVVK